MFNLRGDDDFQNISVKAEGGRYQGLQLLPDIKLGAVVLKLVIAVGLAAEDIKVLVTAGDVVRESRFVVCV